MVRLRGQKAEFTGVVAGMSGSPVYIDGKLVGALSYRWGSFTKEAIGGITPIADMLEVGNYSDKNNQRRFGAVPSLPSGPRVVGAGQDYGEWLASGFWTEAQSTRNEMQTTGGADAMMTPIATPLVFSGFDRRLFDQFAGYFRQNNFVPTIGGAGARDVKQDTEFEPGAAICCLLMRGDMSIAATGTITYRDGDRVLAFGHPMFQMGSADIPMSKANIVLTLSSSLGSSKIAQPTEIVGSIKQDRLTAIMGKVGPVSRMIPVSIDVQNSRGQKQSFNFEVFEDPFLTPLLFNLAVSNAMMGTLDYESVQTIGLEGRVEVDGHQSLRVNDVVSSDDNDLLSPLAIRIAGNLARVFSGLYNNGLERPSVKKISLTIKQVAERRGAVIEEVRADREEVKPGEEFSLAVVLRPYRGDRIVKLLKLRAPETAERDRELRLMVSDAAGFEAAEGRLGRGALAQVASLDELISTLNKVSPSNAIYLRASQSTTGAVINQQALPSLPLSVLAVMGSRQTAANTVTAPDSALMTASEPVEFPVTGRRSLRLMVK
ncbi:MAG TPA: hypothetical protein VFV34_26530, partial [Blastocatellia bacterium]|nr:hypothetical protein [Blastocatellia bacterium]